MEKLPYYRALCMWFVEIPGFQHAESANDLKKAMKGQLDIFEERDFDKVDRAQKEYLEYVEKDTQD